MLFNVDITYADINSLMDAHRENESTPEWLIKLFNEFVDETQDGEYHIYLNNIQTRTMLMKDFEYEADILGVIEHYDANDDFLVQYTTYDGRKPQMKSVASAWEVIKGDLNEKFRDWLMDYYLEE